MRVNACARVRRAAPHSGYVTPLLVAASATGALTRVLALRQYSAWVTPASGVLLVTGGVYSVLSRVAH
jgi:cytochrome c-type biogenesis protein